MSSPSRDDLERSSHQNNDDQDSGSTTPLSLTRTRSQDISIADDTAVHPLESAKDEVDQPETKWPASVKYLILLCAFLTSLSFGVTQVPLLYVFRLMTCDAYYEEHPDHSQKSWPSNDTFLTTMTANSDLQTDRCALHAIESATAMSISLLGASNTVFGLINLFLTGSLIKKIGVKPTLLMQIFFPAARLLVQNIGVEVWGKLGIIIIQCSQIVSIIGGPSGYLLALNTFMTDVVEYEGRTAALGRVTGSMMFGSALGFLLGGVLAEDSGIKAPFRLTFALFLCTTVYAAIFLPHIPPARSKDDIANQGNAEKKKNLLSKYFGPLLVFAPRKFISGDGIIQTEYGAFLLAWGVFLGILATGYLPTVLQLYSTDVFGFGTKENGWLIFMYSMLRGVFLTFAFPKLIAVGRKRVSSKSKQGDSPGQAEDAEREPLLSGNPARGNDRNRSGRKKEQTFTFDLTYTRLSLLADGFLTVFCSFVRQGWQMYLMAGILPFAAGTSSAAKGTVLQMVGSSATSAERTDALAGVSLVENMARLSTTFLFGMVFGGFASIGRTELVFVCNAATALVGFGVLLFARFPPEGSRRLDQNEGEENPSTSSES